MGPCCRLGASVQPWAGGAIQDHPGREAGFKRCSQAGQGQAGQGPGKLPRDEPCWASGSRVATPKGRDPDAGWGEQVGDAGTTFLGPGHQCQAALGDVAPRLLPPSPLPLSLPVFFLLSFPFICVYVYFHFSMLFFPLLLPPHTQQSPASLSSTSLTFPPTHMMAGHSVRSVSPAVT